MVWVREERGQTMAEYGLILALVAVVVIVAITLLGSNISAFFNTLAGNFT
jgi:pilus assembly protein Flp/PilA